MPELELHDEGASAPAASVNGQRDVAAEDDGERDKRAARAAAVAAAKRREEKEDKALDFRSSAQPSRRARQARADEEFHAANEELDSILESLDIKAGDRWKFTLNRVSPTEDPVTGENIKGWTADYENEPPTQAMIDERFGGGTYDLQIRGPKPGEPQPWGLITQVRLTIAGGPIPKPPKRRPGQPGVPGVPGAQGAFDPATIVQQMATASREQQDQLIRAMEAKGGNGQNSEVFTMMMKMLDPQRSQTQFENERKARDDERRQERADRDAAQAHERQLREDERAREKDERAAERAKAAAEAAHAAEMAKIKMEAEIARAKSEAQVAIETAKAQAAQQMEMMKLQAAQIEANTKLQVEQMKTQAAAERAFATELNKSTQDVQTKLLTVTQDSQKQQMEFMATQLKHAQAAQQVKDPTKDLLDKLDLIDRIRGDGGDGEDPLPLRMLEKSIEGVSKVAPGLFAAAGVGMSAKKAADREAAKQQAQQAAEVEEGSVAVLDGEQGRVRKKLRRQAPGAPAAPGKTTSREVDGVTVIDADKAAVAAATGEGAEAVPNDLTDFVFPSAPPHAQLDLELVELLVKNVDFAIRRNMEAKDILEKVVKRFPKAVVDYIANASIDDTLGRLESLPTIQGWAINSLSGQAKMRQIHKLMQ